MQDFQQQEGRTSDASISEIEAKQIMEMWSTQGRDALSPSTNITDIAKALDITEPEVQQLLAKVRMQNQPPAMVPQQAQISEAKKLSPGMVLALTLFALMWVGGIGYFGYRMFTRSSDPSRFMVPFADQGDIDVSIEKANAELERALANLEKDSADKQAAKIKAATDKMIQQAFDHALPPPATPQPPKR